MIRKLAVVTALFAASICALSSAKAATVTETSVSSTSAVYSMAEQPRLWRNRRVTVYTQTRIRRIGFRTYRETVQIRRLPNGRTTTRVISRVRIR